MKKEVNAGDKIIIKSEAEIYKTLDQSNRSSRGITFYEDMCEYCEKEFWVGKKEGEDIFLTPPTRNRKWDIDWLIPTKLHISIDPRDEENTINFVRELCQTWSNEMKEK